MFMQAYTMAAQAQQYFPLSSLFRMLNVEGKDRLLPVIEANEEKQDILTQLQQQNEDMSQQMAQLQKENQNLRRVTASLADSLSGTGVTTDKAASPEEQITGEDMAQLGREELEMMPEEAD
jgi:Mg2+ and Co2+ transporter CorA